MSSRLKDIAAETGISPTAVSYVLNGRGNKVSLATREKVLRAASRLGYRPNSSARAVRQGWHGALALIMSPSPHRSLLTPELMLGITAELSRSRLRLLVDYVNDDQLTSEKSLPRLLRERACDGMLLNYSTHVPPMLAELAERFRLPTVWINARHDFNSVCPDDFGAARLATETLLSKGRRRVAYYDAGFNSAVSSGNLHFSKLDRRAGYEAAMQTAGLPCELLLDPEPPLPASFTRRQSVVACAERLHVVFRRRRPAPPDAVVCYGGWDFPILRQVLAELHADPELVTFGFNDNAFNDHLVNGLVVPFEEIGRRAVAMLLRRISNPAPVPSEIVPFRWGDTSSC